MSKTPRVVLFMSPGAGYDRGLFYGIARYARHYGPWVFLPYWEQRGIPKAMPFEMDVKVSRFKRIQRHSKSLVHQLEHLGATGVIGRLLTPELLEAIFTLNLPTIGLDLTDEQLADARLSSRISEMRPDSHKAGRLAARHLLERGFRRFAFCGHALNPNWSRQRAEGFCQRLREAGFGCDIYSPPRSKPPVYWHREHPVVVAWLQSLQKPVGIMACNDVRGRQVIEACAFSGMRVPNDVAVVGVDEDEVLSELSNPPLSSVAWNALQGGYQAAELLHRMMTGRQRKPRQILVEPLWVNARLSTDVIAVEDRDVAETVRYIHENARQRIQISDVVKHASISRRALEIRFHRSLGWSIRAEIERVRIGLAKQLLAETDLPVVKIAAHAGFSGEDYLGKVFRRVTHMTPTEYRRTHRSV